MTMLDLPGHPTLDKVDLIGACSRLRVDAGCLQAQVAKVITASAQRGLLARLPVAARITMRGAH